MKRIPKWAIIHHCGGSDANPLMDSSNQTFEDVNAWHRENPNTWLGRLSSLGYALGYTYFIDKTGKVTQGRADDEQSAHTKGYNNNEWDPPENASIGICLSGNFDFSMPSVEQINALKLLLRSKMTEYQIPIENIVPHRKFAVKSCYGNLLADNWARNLVLPPVKKVESCEAESRVIIEKDKQIFNLQKLVNYLIGLLNRNKLGSNNNFMNNIDTGYISSLALVLVGILKIFGVEIGTEVITGLVASLLAIWAAYKKWSDNRKAGEPINVLGKRV